MIQSSATPTVSPFRFDSAAVSLRPYPHFEAANFLDPSDAEFLLEWFERKAPWQPRRLQGYEGYADIPLQLLDLPARLKPLLASELLSNLRGSMARCFAIEPEGYVKVTAHRLLKGSSLRPHTDLAPLPFTHRLIIHLNRGWSAENGGLLLLFDGDPAGHARTAEKTLVPVHRSAFAFQVSRRSFHAVTPVVAGERYTLSYTFYPPQTK